MEKGKTTTPSYIKSYLQSMLEDMQNDIDHLPDDDFLPDDCSTSTWREIRSMRDDHKEDLEKYMQRIRLLVRGL